MNSAGQRSPTRPLAQRKLALGPSETSPSPRRPALTSRRVSEPTGSPREGTSCLPVNCTGTGDRFPYPSPLRGKITGLAVFGSAASPTVRYFSTAAGLPAGVGVKASSLRDIRGRDDHPRPLRIAVAGVRWFTRRNTRSSRNKATSEISGFGKSQSFFPCSGSPSLPLLSTGCQNPALVLLPAPGLEFCCFRNAYRGSDTSLYGRSAPKHVHIKAGSHQRSSSLQCRCRDRNNDVFRKFARCQRD